MILAELYIEGNRVDLEQAETIALSYGVNRLTDIETRQGYYSNTFNLPLTERNREIFGFVDQINSLDNKRWKKLDAYINVAGIRMVTGFAFLKQSNNQLELTFKGGNTEWVDNIRSKKLSDLNLSDLDHTPTAATVHANRFNDYTSGFVYPDVDYGILKYMRSEIPSFILYPSVFVRTLFERVIYADGWTLVNDLNTVDLYNEMVIPFSNERIYHSEEWSEGLTFNASIETHTISEVDGVATWWGGLDNDSTSGFFDNGNQVTLGTWDNSTPLAGFTPSEQYEQRVTAEIQYTITFWDVVNSQLNFAFPNIGVLDEYVSYSHGVSNGGGTGTFTAVISARTVEELAQSLEITSAYVGVTITGGRMYNEILSKEYYRGSEWNFAVNMPTDFLQTDLVKYVLNAFCAIAIPDNISKTLRIVPFDNIPQNNSEDWSDKIDLSEKPTYIPEYGNFKFDNILEYSNDKGDDALKDTPDLGKHSIQNTYRESGETKLYKAPFSLCGRRLTMNETIEKAFIHLHSSSIGKVDAFIKNITITGVSNDGVVSVSSNADTLQEGDRFVMEGLNGSQTWIGNSIEGITFTITGIPDNQTIETNKTFAGSTASTGTLRATIWRNYASLEDASEIDKDYEVIFTGLNGSQTVEGLDINGAIARVTLVSGDRSIQTNKQVVTTTYPTEGSVVYVEEYFDFRKTNARIAVHQVIQGSTKLIQIQGQPVVTAASELYDAPIYWSALAGDWWVSISSFILTPQTVKMLMRLSAVDIHGLDFSKPKWIGHFGCRFYLSYVDQYKVNANESTDVELVRLP